MFLQFIFCYGSFQLAINKQTTTKPQSTWYWRNTTGAHSTENKTGTSPLPCNCLTPSTPHALVRTEGAQHELGNAMTCSCPYLGRVLREAVVCMACFLSHNAHFYINFCPVSTGCLRWWSACVTLN